MNFKQLKEQLGNMKAAGAANIEFVKGAEDLECYPEAGMRATIVDVIDDHDEVMKVRVSYEAFDEFNKAFESHNYFDRASQPVLNAREAGYYKVVEDLYVMENDSIGKFFNLLSSEASKLYNSYMAESGSSGQTYVQWLEALVVQHVVGK